MSLPVSIHDSLSMRSKFNDLKKKFQDYFPDKKLPDNFDQWLEQKLFASKSTVYDGALEILEKEYYNVDKVRETLKTLLDAKLEKTPDVDSFYAGVEKVQHNKLGGLTNLFSKEEGIQVQPFVVEGIPTHTGPMNQSYAAIKDDKGQTFVFAIPLYKQNEEGKSEREYIDYEKLSGKLEMIAGKGDKFKKLIDLIAPETVSLKPANTNFNTKNNEFKDTMAPLITETAKLYAAEMYNNDVPFIDIKKQAEYGMKPMSFDTEALEKKLFTTSKEDKKIGRDMTFVSQALKMMPVIQGLELILKEKKETPKKEEQIDKLRETPKLKFVPQLVYAGRGDLAQVVSQLVHNLGETNLSYADIKKQNQMIESLLNGNFSKSIKQLIAEEKKNPGSNLLDASVLGQISALVHLEKELEKENKKAPEMEVVIEDGRPEIDGDPRLTGMGIR